MTRQWPPRAKRTVAHGCTRERATALHAHNHARALIHSFVHSFIQVSHSSTHGTGTRSATRNPTQHLRSSLCQNKCMVRTASFSPAILVTGWWLVLCALFFCVFLHFEGSFAYFSVFPSVCAPLFLFFTVFVRCCGRASPLELLLMVFGAYSRMSLREQ